MSGQNNIKTGIKEAIVRTIAFFDLFNYPLTLFEIWKYLGVEASYDEVEAALSEPDLRAVIGEKIGFYFPIGREDSIEARHERQALSHHKSKVAIRAAKILRHISGMRLIAVCNNFSYRPDSDVDLFIVVAKNRLWLTRLLSAVIMQIFGLRRYGKKIADRVCLSFYVTDDNLDLSSVAFADDPYFYYWLAWLTPIYDDICYADFWQKNQWLKQYLPNVFSYRTGDERLVRDNYFSLLFKRLNNYWFNSVVGNYLERTVKIVQLSKMAKNISSVAAADDTRVVINDRMLKFHEQDRRAEYRERMEAGVADMLGVLEYENTRILEYENKNEESKKARKQESKGENTGILEYENTRIEESNKARKQENNLYVHSLIGQSGFILKMLRWSLYLLVFLLAWQARWMIVSGVINSDYFEYGTIGLYGVDILLGLLFCLVLYNRSIVAHLAELGKNVEGLACHRSVADIKKYGTLLFLMAGLDLMIFVSIFSSDNKFASAYFYFKFLLGIGVFWLATNLRYDRLKLYYAFFAGVFLQAVLAIWQFLNQTTFANKWLGMSMHSAGEGMASVIEVAGGGRWLRAYGSLDHPNMLGGFLAVGLLLAVWVNLSGRYKLDKFGFLAVNFIYVPVVSAALFLTFSRAAWLGAMLGVGLMMFTAVLKKDLLGQKKILRIVLVAGVVCFVLFACFEDLITTRLSNDTRLEMKSTNERLSSLSLAGEIIRSAPLFGIGAGNYANYINIYISPDLSSSAYQPVHNVYLLVIAEIGFVGFLFFVSIFVYLLMLIIKSGLEKRENYYLLAMLASLLAMMMFDHWWWSLHFGVVLFWMVLGMVFKEVESYKVESYKVI
jgi:O-antigen ligase